MIAWHLLTTLPRLLFLLTVAGHLGRRAAIRIGYLLAALRHLVAGYLLAALLRHLLPTLGRHLLTTLRHLSTGHLLAALLWQLPPLGYPLVILLRHLIATLLTILLPAVSALPITAPVVLLALLLIRLI